MYNEAQNLWLKAIVDYLSQFRELIGCLIFLCTWYWLECEVGDSHLRMGWTGRLTCLASSSCWLLIEGSAGTVNQSTYSCHFHVVWISSSIAAGFWGTSAVNNQRDLGRSSKAFSDLALKVPKYHFCPIPLGKQSLVSAWTSGPTPWTETQHWYGSLGGCLPRLDSGCPLHPAGKSHLLDPDPSLLSLETTLSMWIYASYFKWFRSYHS